MTALASVFLLGAGSLLAIACAPPTTSGANAVARGRYLVNAAGCADCHSPHGPDGKPLAGLELSGHPADAPLPSWEPGMLQTRGVATIAATGTAFAGPFGLSVAPNLTPDPTGIAGTAADQLLESWRTGRHWRESRAILPPMPATALANLDESDVRAIHAYLMTLTPVHNAPPTSKPAAPSGD